MNLRDYQDDILAQLNVSTSNDMVQLDTGAGKTPIEAALAQWTPHCLLVAHRNILITQISEKLAACGLAHDTITLPAAQPLSRATGSGWAGCCGQRRAKRMPSSST